MRKLISLGGGLVGLSLPRLVDLLEATAISIVEVARRKAPLDGFEIHDRQAEMRTFLQVRAVDRERGDLAARFVGEVVVKHLGHLPVPKMTTAGSRGLLEPPAAAWSGASKTGEPAQAWESRRDELADDGALVRERIGSFDEVRSAAFS